MASSLNVGDLWSIGAAVASAMFILRLESASSQVQNSSALNSASLWVVTLLSLVWTLLSIDPHSSVDETLSCMDVLSTAFTDVEDVVTSHPFALVYLGGITTALANYIQTRGQRGIAAERASVIYAMDPVYGALFAYFLLDEHLGVYGYAGAALITVAAATNAFLDLGSKDKRV